MKNPSSWKLWLHLLGYFFCFGIAGSIAAIPRFIFGLENEQPHILFLSEIARIPITIYVLYLYARHIAKMPEINTKLLSFKGWRPLKWFILGSVLPVLLISSMIAMNYLQLVDANWNLPLPVIATGLLVSLAIALASGILEELVFRGYMLETLNKKYSFWVAGLSPAIIFALIHMGGAGNVLNGIQILAGGILVSVLFMSVYKVTGSIWNACIIHGLWNFIILNDLISIGNHENGIPGKFLTLSPIENNILSGGQFGIEVSLNAIFLYIIAAFLILYFNKKGTKSAII
ncbi:MAG: CPBP family intramembrane metalloprotease [Bacteroidia bacterium]|nr:CPBP family intramembrane metalloprotease [Bacteroidia bacterium]